MILVVISFFKTNSRNFSIVLGKVYVTSASIFALFTPTLYYFHFVVNQTFPWIGIPLVYSSSITIFALAIQYFGFNKDINLNTEDFILIRIFLFSMLLTIFPFDLIVPAIKVQLIWYSLGAQTRNIVISVVKKCLGVFKYVFFGFIVWLFISYVLSELNIIKPIYADGGSTKNSTEIVQTVQPSNPGPNRVLVNSHESNIDPLLRGVSAGLSASSAPYSSGTRVVSTAHCGVQFGWSGILQLRQAHNFIMSPMSPMALSKSIPLKEIMPFKTVTIFKVMQQQPVIMPQACGQEFLAKNLTIKYNCPNCPTERVNLSFIPENVNNQEYTVTVFSHYCGYSKAVIRPIYKIPKV